MPSPEDAAREKPNPEEMAQESSLENDALSSETDADLDARALAEAAEALAEEEEAASLEEEASLHEPASLSRKPEPVKPQDMIPSAGTSLQVDGLEDTTLDFIQSFNRQLDQIQEMKEGLEAESVELKKEIAARERTIGQQRRRLVELEQEAQRAVSLEQEVQRLQHLIESTRGELESAKAELRNRDATIKQKDASIAELNASHDAMVSKTIDLKEEIQSLKEERVHASAEIETLKSEREEILNEKRRIEQAMNQLDAKYQAAHDEVMSARRILGELQSAFETSQKKARTILDKKIRPPQGGTGNRGNK